MRDDDEDDDRPGRIRAVEVGDDEDDEDDEEEEGGGLSAGAEMVCYGATAAAAAFAATPFAWLLSGPVAVFALVACVCGMRHAGARAGLVLCSVAAALLAANGLARAAEMGNEFRAAIRDLKGG